MDVLVWSLTAKPIILAKLKETVIKIIKELKYIIGFDGS